MDSQRKHQYSSAQPLSIARHLMIRYILFFTLHCLLDIILLIIHIDDLKFIVGKLAIDSIVTILILTLQKKFNDICMNILIAITKLTSLIIIAVIGYDVILLIIFIQEVNTMSEQQKEYLIQRIVTKIGGLILMVICSSILDIIIMLFILLMETYNVYTYFQSKKNQQIDDYLCNQQSRTLRESSSFCCKDNNWANKIQIMPIAIILFSIKDLKIIFSNKICYQYFNGQCENQSGLEEFILDKIYFQIVKYNEFSQIGSKLMEQQNTKQEYETILITDRKFCLRSIMQMYLEGKYYHDLNQLTNSLELQCQQCWDFGAQSFYSCQLNFNLEEGEIQLIILDITQYHHFQVDLIQDQFKTQIVQSFSHELRTPLNSACNFLQCCITNKSIQKEIRSNFIKPAFNALRLQSHIINDIIDFNCLYVHDIELELKEFFIKDIIDEVNRLFKSSIEMKKLALYVDLFENSLLTIKTDFARLMQIIVNIMQNAIKYSNKGIIILKLSNFSSDHVKFTIKDEGIGISEDRFIQIQRMLQMIEVRSRISKYKKWYGFGLLISQMLLSKLCPQDFKSLLIRSGGKDQGTKVSFYIKNHGYSVSTPSSSSHNKMNTIRQSSKIQSITKQISINGTIIQISDLMASYRKLNWMKNGTVKSNDYSSIPDSFHKNDLDQKMHELNHVIPSLITDIGKSKQLTNELQVVDSPLFKSARDLQMQNVVRYKKLELKDDQDSEVLLQQIFKKRKCTCKRILSVDDEIFNQKSIQYLLSQHGFDVTLAFYGEEAIKVIQTIERCSQSCNIFMVILMDYQMPVMDGIQTTKALCQMMQQQVIPQIHIVGLTAFHGKKDIQNCIEAGMSDVLAKPLKIKEFYDILNLF